MLVPLSPLPLSSTASSVVKRRAICQKTNNPSSTGILLIHSIQQECRRRSNVNPALSYEQTTFIMERHMWKLENKAIISHHLLMLGLLSKQ
jgi:hypothetical protein